MTFTFQSSKLKDVYKGARLFLREEGVESADIDARLLISHATQISKEDFLTSPNMEFSTDILEQLSKMLEARCSGRPVSKIIGRKGFYGRDFIVSDDVLDPRPETEGLIERVLELTTKTQKFTFVDLGTGSGCIAITILKERPNANGVATDISSKALQVAKQNAKVHELSNARLTFLESNWLESVTGEFDFILSNPPYIESETIQNLQKEVQNHDPILALDGGITGINPYVEILDSSFSHLNSDGRIIFEIGKGQESRIARLVEDRSANLEATLPDLAGILRIVDISSGDKQKNF